MACRTERQKRELVRIVRTPSGEVALDRSGRMAGRGAYLCADGSCWSLALKKKALERALGVPLSAELRDQLAVGPSEPVPGSALPTLHGGLHGA